MYMSVNELKAEARMAVAKKYRILTAFDDRTCEICRPYENRVFPVSKAVTGKTLPPFHDGCRCGTALEFD